LRLKEELAKLMPPYIDLGFDHHMRDDLTRMRRNCLIGSFQTIEHVARYGRPLYVLYIIPCIPLFIYLGRWYANLQNSSRRKESIIELASSKLINGERLEEDHQKRTEQVFAILSQRFCLDPILTNAEAMKLAERSVAHNMRLLTGFSPDHSMFFTHSPSEPMLVLGAVHKMYTNPETNRLGMMLDVLNQDLCKAGLVDKGLLGELCARILILIARDYASPSIGFMGKDLLQPVLLLKVLEKLFGTTQWASFDQEHFDCAFAKASINFTHWVVTSDMLPAKPSR
jgi:hypothetical protein